MAKWKSEIVKLTAERKLIEADYYKLRDEVKEAELFRKSIYSLQRCESGTAEDATAEGAGF